MNDLMKALYSFWSSFGLPAYVESAVPENAELPYITYEVMTTNAEMSQCSAQVWYWDTSYFNISSKVDQIAKQLETGAVLKQDGLPVAYLAKGTPFCQYRSFDDIETKNAVLSVMIMTKH